MNSKFNYGSVFKVTREDDLTSIDMNLKQMSESGFNTVVVWPAVFWWEEKTKDYPFATGKKLLDIAAKYNLKIVMELAGQLTSMEYAPDFLMKPEYNAISRDGHREFGQGSFGFINYFHPEVKTLICDHYKKVAEAYKGHSALLAYDIFNETMFRSFDEHTLNQFRIWLKNKYKSIERLNAVWERTYSDFNEINFEQWKWMSIMPEADYNAFRRESVAVILKDWYDAIRSVDDEIPIMADNIFSQTSPIELYDRPQDDFGLKDTVDEIGMSFYPKQLSGTFTPALRLQMLDGFYAASKREGFWIAEMQTHIQALFNPNTCVMPGELKQWCMESYSAGAKSLIYWMWRPFNKGIQTLGRGLVNYKNLPTERLEVAKKLAEVFNRYGVISPVRGKVGIVYEPLCDDFSRIFAANYKLEENLYNLSLYGAYKAFLKCNVKSDIIRLSEIKNYSFIVLSNHLVLSKSDAALLTDYVKNGGVIIVDGRFGMVDETALLNNILPGGELNPLIGEEFYDFDNGNAEFNYDGVTLSGIFGREKMNIMDGEVTAIFTDGLPAVVEKSTGKGKIITFNTAVWFDAASDDEDKEDKRVMHLAKALADKFSLSYAKTNMDVTVRISQNETSYLAFVFNYTDRVQKGEITIALGSNLYTISAEVEPNDVNIITVSR